LGQKKGTLLSPVESKAAVVVGALTSRMPGKIRTRANYRMSFERSLCPLTGPEKTLGRRRGGLDHGYLCSRRSFPDSDDYLRSAAGCQRQGYVPRLPRRRMTGRKMSLFGGPVVEISHTPGARRKIPPPAPGQYLCRAFSSPRGTESTREAAPQCWIPVDEKMNRTCQSRERIQVKYVGSRHR